MDHETNRPETLDVVMTLFEHQKNQGQYEQLNQTMADITALHKANHNFASTSESYLVAWKDLGETATELQTRLLKSPNSKEAPILLKTLGTLYSVFIQVLPEKDPRVAQAHYNLAETFFQNHDYENSTVHYQWVLSHWNDKNELKKHDVQLKSIASLYEVLRSTNWIPLELSPLPFDLVKSDEWKQRLPKQSLEWINWIDTLSKELLTSNQSFENFEFEANRAIYAYSSPSIATARLIEFAMKKPQSKFAIPSATLALDTYIKGQNWVGTSELALRFLTKQWNEPSFAVQISGVAADASYKLAEASFKSGKYLNAIHQAKELQKDFSKSARAADGLLLIAQSYLALQQKDTAQLYFSQLISEYPNSQGRDTALLNRAQISEESYDIGKAVQDYKIYLTSIKDISQVQSLLEIQKRIYFLQWLNEESDFHCSTPLVKSDLHLDSIMNECRRYEALSLLKKDPKTFSISSEKMDKYFNLALKGFKENRALWSSVVLKFDASIELQDQIYLLKNVSKGWESLEPLIQVTLVPELSSLIPASFAKARQNLKKEVPLNRASAQAITRRAEWIKEYENTASTALSLPWTRIRASVLFELSGVYSDFSSTLAGLASPQGLSAEETNAYLKSVHEIVEPFQAKSLTLAAKAYQLASNASIEDEALKPIREVNLDTLKKQNLELHTKLPQMTATLAPEALNLNLLKLVTPNLDLKLMSVSSARAAYARSSEQLPSLLKSLWIDSYQNRTWAKASFLLQEMKLKKAASPSELKVMQGLMLSASGAKSEGLIELQGATSGLDTNLKRRLNQIILSHYAYSVSIETATRIVQEIEKLDAQLLSEKTGKQS